MSARDLAVVQPTRAHSRVRRYRFTLRRNSKKPWPELQWRHQEGRVTLRMPIETPLRDCLAAFEQRVAWFDAYSTRGLRPKIMDIVPIDGTPRSVVHCPDLDTALRLDDTVLWVRNGDAKRRERDLLKFISSRTLTAIRQHVADKAAMLGMEPGHIRLSSALRKWGACDRNNNLDFSWRLAMAPPFVQEYLAAHEVAHFKHKHHQPAFWEQVNTLMPRWSDAEHWLAFCGASLMATQLNAIAPAPPGPHLRSVPSSPQGVSAQQ